MTALVRRVPLTLLLDLADPQGPDSAVILATETADLSWMAGLAFPTPTEPTAPAATAAANRARRNADATGGRGGAQSRVAGTA